MVIKDENYITIQGWMITRLGLKGNELLIYAIIYGFSQNYESGFAGSINYLSDFSNCARRTVINCLKSMTEKGLILKRDRIENGVKYCEYFIPEGSAKIAPGVVQNLQGGSAKIAPGVVQNFPEGSAKIAPNNKRYNSINNTNDNNCDFSKRFVAPTVEEVRAYCRERNNNVDAEAFVDFYTSKGWKIGKNPMKDWRAAVRTWERTSRSGSGKQYGRNGVEILPESEQLHDLDEIF